MNLGEILLSEKTRVSLNIATVLLVAGFIVSTVFSYTKWSTNTVNRIDNVENQLEKEAEERKTADEKIRADLSEVNDLVNDFMLEYGKDMVEVKTNLQWLVDKAKERSE